MNIRIKKSGLLGNIQFFCGQRLDPTPEIAKKLIDDGWAVAIPTKPERAVVNAKER